MLLRVGWRKITANRDREGPHGLPPPTPPDIRVTYPAVRQMHQGKLQPNRSAFSRRATLPSDPASRRLPCASLVLRLHAYLDGGLAPPSMTACTAHTPGMSRVLQRVGSMPLLASSGHACCNGMMSALNTASTDTGA